MDTSSSYTFPARFLNFQTDLAGSEAPQQQQQLNWTSPLSPGLLIPVYPNNSWLSSDQPTSASPMRRSNHYKSSLSSLGSAGPASPYTANTTVKSPATVANFYAVAIRSYCGSNSNTLTPVYNTPQEHFLAPHDAANQAVQSNDQVERGTTFDDFGATYKHKWYMEGKRRLSVQPVGSTTAYCCQAQGCKSQENSWPRLDDFRSHLERIHALQFETDEELQRTLRRTEFFEPDTVETSTPAIDGGLKPQIVYSNFTKFFAQKPSSYVPMDDRKIEKVEIPAKDMMANFGVGEHINRKKRELMQAIAAVEKMDSPGRAKNQKRALGSHGKLEAISQTILKRLPQKIGNFKRKAVRIMLNGKETLARPDAGASKDVMSLSLARSLKIPIQTSPSDKGVFSLGNGKVVESLGRAYLPCSLFGDSKSQESRWFHVLSKLVVPLVMSFEWIEKIGLYTKRKDLLVECPSWFGNMPTLKWLGSPQGRIKFEADGRVLTGCADTGSDLDFISLSCARKRGFAIDRRPESRSRVMMADGTICSTEGTVHMSSIKLADFDSFDMKFHVLDGLPSDVIFGEEFLEQIDAFNTCSGIMDIEDHYLDGLNTLINLGPIQAFFSRKWGSKKAKTPKQQSHDVMEEKLYWKNKLTRSYARVVEEDNGVLEDIRRGGEGTNELDPVPPNDTGIKREIVDGEVNGKVEREATAQKAESIQCAQRTSAQVVGERRV